MTSADGHSDNYCKLVACVMATINEWEKADKLTVLEQRERAQRTIYGIVKAALFVLKTKEYFDFIDYIHQRGFNH